MRGGEKAVKEIGDVLSRLVGVFAVDDLVARAFIKAQFGRDAVCKIGFVQFFCPFTAKSHHVLRARKDADRRVGVEFCKILLFVKFRRFAHHIEVKGNAHIGMGILSPDKGRSDLVVVVDPLGFSLVALELEQVIRKKVYKLGAPLSCDEEDGESEDLAERAKGAHVSRAEEGDGGDVGACLGKRLTEETAVGVSRQKDGQVVLFLEPFAKEKLVLQSVAENIATMSAAILVRLGPAVCAVIVRKDDVASRVQIACKLVVVSAVFAHAVQQLHHAFGIFNVIPEGAVDLGIVKTFECKFLHNSSPVMFYPK